MSKPKKRHAAPASATRSAVADSSALAAGVEPSFWRGLWNEPLALGLGLLVLLRPWRDGLTFTAFNAYYFAFVLVLAAVWCARGLLRPAALRAAAPIGILASFVVTAWLTGYAAYSYDPASQGLQRITIGLLVFVLASNGLRTRRSVEIVCVAIIVGWLLSSLWTIFHYNVMLKGMRQILRDNPNVMEQYFGVTVPSPELKHRLESNRAFGTFLFPNALGAFLILGLPVLVAALPDAIAVLRRVGGRAPIAGSQRSGWVATGLAIGAGAATLSLFYFGNEFIGVARPDQRPPIAGAYRPFAIFLPAALAIGGATAWLVRSRGALFFGRACLAAAVPLAVLASAVSLWLSYSRGAGMALLAAGLLATLLVNARRWTWMARVVRAAAVLAALAGGLLIARDGGAQDGASFEIPDPLPNGIYYEQRRFDAINQEMTTLNIEGSERQLGSLGDLASFRNRTTYWQAGMKMFADNLWTGVGLGNFKIAYPKYQFLGAGDVETAHNDFLQFYCETGIVGGSLFVAFWVYFGVWGARRMLQEPDAWTRRWLTATYAGTLAFTMHTLVDFDFQNPALSMIAFVFAGLFFALAHLRDAGPEITTARTRAGRRALAAALGIVVAACTSSVMRDYLFELGLTEGEGIARLYYVGDRKPMDARLRAAADVWKVLNEPAPPEATAPPPRYIHLSEALLVVPDLAELNAVGVLRVPVREKPGTLRPLKPGEAPPANTYLFFTDLPRAREFVTTGCERRVAELREWDESYPHDPELSAHIFTWYEILFGNAADAAAKRRYAIAAEDWAHQSMLRSPQTAWWHANYAKALWMRASLERGPEGVEYYRTGLEHYKMSHDLYPRKSIIASQYGQALYKLGAEFEEAGAVDEGQGLMKQGEAMLERAAVLDQYDALVR